MSVPRPRRGRPAKSREGMAPPVATWTSSLDIAATPYESKRAPRKSKTDAMAAINHRSMSPSPVRFAPPLRPSVPPRDAPRLMDTEECPVFRPTLDEFRDPMAYIRSIHDTAERYGIIKIVPPKEWDMPFVADTETFRFKTRLQRLNSIEASSRAKMAFLEQLYRYHEQGASGVSVPLINHQPLDLWLLRREVQRRGGYDTVSRDKLWGDVQRAMGYTGPSVLAAQLKAAYTRIISPYEYFRAQVRHDPSPAHARRVQPARRGSKPRPFATATTPPSSPLTPSSSSPLSEPPDDHSPKKASDPGPSKLPQDPGPSVPVPVHPSPPARKGETCELCLKGDRDTEMLLCDGCDEGYHMSCLDPPLHAVPKGSWFCHACMFGNNDYGFDEGEEHTLASFQQRDLQFRKLWFENHPPQPPTWDDPTRRPIPDSNIAVSEDDVEREFWRLVESSHETVEVEYGADVHSTTHGSAMPSVESHPRDPYSRDPWNVNNLPILQDSLLRYIKSDISGMTVPWTYVGMLFSTFCWHNEDHYTYSLNYMHWGETKTWYGIPGEDAQKFEDAIKSEAPDLFEAQPDLLFQLVTLMNPDRLRKAGVRVFACNQRPGEFVITFPKAYHAGFNHGLNFNEAVNFALPEWLPLGLECVQRYQEHRKLPVFSHDELLVTITQHALSVKNAQWLYINFKEMVERELEQRAALAAQFPGRLNQTLDDADRPEDQYQCSICKVFCYLAQVTCQCTPAVACLAHAASLCNCHLSSRILRRRFSEEWLQDTLREIELKANAPVEWREKFAKAIQGPKVPSVAELRLLALDGEALQVPMMELKALQRCVKRALEWSEEVTQLLDHVPPRRKRPRVEEPESDFKYGVADIQRLLGDIRKMGVEMPEKVRLETLFDQVEDFAHKAGDLLHKLGDSEDTSPLPKFEELVLIGKNLRLDLDELARLEQLVARLQFFQILQSVNDNGLTLDQVEELIRRGQRAGVSSKHRFMVELQRKAAFGGEWKARAVSTLKQPRPAMRDLNQLVVPVQWIPTLPDILDKLDQARMRGRNHEKVVEACLRPPRGTLVPIEEAQKIAVAALNDVFFQAAEDLRALSADARMWEKACEDVIAGRYKPRSSTSNVFDELLAMREEGKAKFWAFRMPWFDDLIRQLAVHEDWVGRLFWTRPKHPALELESILGDVSGDSELGVSPPSNEACTCLCVEPVVLIEGQHSPEMEVVQCDHCLAKFHAKCIEGSCPFCDHHHWNGSMDKPRKFTLTQLVAQYKSACELSRHYSYDYRKMGAIIMKCDNLGRPILAFMGQIGQQGSPDPNALPQIRHLMRRLYRIQFDITPSSTPSFGLSLAHLHRMVAPQPAPKRRLNRKPKFMFKSEVDPKAPDGTQCLCGGAAAPLNLELILCSKCQTRYHVACVAFASLEDAPDPFVCPLCLLKKGKSYGPADVRVKYPDDDPEENAKFVDVKACLDKYSYKIIRRSLPPPHRTTITVQLHGFIPGTNPDVDEAESVPSTPQQSHAGKPGSDRAGVPANGSQPSASGSGTLAPPPPPPETATLPVVRRVRLRVKGDSGDEPGKSPASDTPAGPLIQDALRANGSG